MSTAHARPGTRHGAGRGGRVPRWVVPVVLVLLGIAVLLYPVAATQYNNIRQRSFAQEYNSEVQRAAPNDLEGELTRATAYNETISGTPILDPWIDRVGSDPASAAFSVYKGELSRFDAMARIKVPTASIDLPVYHGTSDPVLAKGAGHLYGTALPVGGAGTHAVLTSHTGLANATLFDRLSSVQEGDLMYIEVMGETLAYEVDQIKIVLPSEIGDLTAVQGQDYLTLFTCTPYAVNTHRLLVRGVRVPYSEQLPGALDEAASPFTFEPWMWWLIGGAGAGGAFLLMLVARERESRRGAAAR